MADDITFDIPPGYLLSPTQVRLQLSERVTALQYTVGGSAPAISKYIAYDVRNPPNPFIAVTQDGKGNVVYDGGFPKIYSNIAPPASATTFGDLTPSFKYVFNALRFIENKTKRLMGNNKILVIGDSTGSYNVKGTSGNHFGTSLARLAAVGGYEFTLKNRADWPSGLIDCTDEELDAYCGVFFMSSMNTIDKLITDQALDALVAYRENGNGILIMTDHGLNLTTLEEAKGTYAAAAYFTTANHLATRFGAWFSGNYSRTPVNVGHIRRTYGDHPLYNGLTDEEDIYASVSESRVFVEPFEPILPTEVEPFDIDVGRTLIQVAAVLSTGEIVTYRAEYNVVDAKVSFTDGKVVRDNGQQLDIGLNNRTVIDVVIDSPDMTVFEGNEGIVSINGVRVGVVTWDAGEGTVFAWDDHDGSALLVNNGDRIEVVFATMGLESAIGIRRFQPPIAGQHSLAVVSTLLRPYKPQLTDIDRVKDLMHEIGLLVPWRQPEYTQNIPQNLRELGLYFSNDELYLPYLKQYVYTIVPENFLAPARWTGYFLNPGGDARGAIDPPSYFGVAIRDMNSPLDKFSGSYLGQEDIDQTLFFQMSFLGTDIPLPAFVSVGEHDRIPLVHSEVKGILRGYYSDGTTNIHAYLTSKVGQPVEIILWMPD